MNIRNLLMIAVLLVSGFAFAENSAEFSSSEKNIICTCTKIWAGGPITYYYGDVVSAGTVVAATMEDAQYYCELNRPQARYNGSLSSCQRQP